MLTQYILFILVIQWSFVSSHKKNVCRTFGDYATIQTNKNCWYNPDIDSSPTVLAKRYGYPMKKYRVTTDDGYILTLFRIPHNGSDINSTRQPVLIQHGIGASAVFWMMQGRRSLAFVLADNGYDVWLSTSRGAGYSRKHTHLTTEDPSYWNFGLHELAVYDLPANIEFISNITEQRGKIIYIGHSMGTTTSYIYSTVKKNHAVSNLKALISLSPVAFLKHFEGWHKLAVAFADIVIPVLQKIGIHYVGDMPPLTVLIQSLCGKYPSILLCQALILPVVGIAQEQVKPDLLPLFAKHYPTGTSLKVLRHFIQIILSGGNFQYYDYKFDNVVVYNSIRPPIYNVTDISLPVYLFVGSQDVLASDRDVDILYAKLNSPGSKTRASKYIFNFAHNDFFMGADVNDFYKVLSDVIKTKIGNI
ncbi:lipase member K-like [Anoplophora glabripennis]|uniref:lipase member K-like n=1 Tax=Anoplophora glabripennis TaxID=217634 RepID=UPI00087565A2|nr:lipase member K-like [Anoplophora glabripennis]